MKKTKKAFVTAFALFTLLGAQVAQAQELPPGYKWVLMEVHPAHRS